MAASIKASSLSTGSVESLFVGLSDMLSTSMCCAISVSKINVHNRQISQLLCSTLRLMIFNVYPVAAARSGDNMAICILYFRV